MLIKLIEGGNVQNQLQAGAVEIDIYKKEFEHNQKVCNKCPPNEKSDVLEAKKPRDWPEKSQEEVEKKMKIKRSCVKCLGRVF